MINQEDYLEGCDSLRLVKQDKEISRQTFYKR